MKKISRIVFSMKFALVLLGILLAACLAGSVIPQGKEASYYLSEYSEQAGGAILALGLDDVFHCAVCAAGCCAVPESDRMQYRPFPFAS